MIIFYIYLQCVILNLIDMIEQFSVKNIFSYKDKMTLSFEATNDQFGEDNLVVKMPDGRRLLRFALIYGPNASGKSNLLYAFRFFHRFLFNATNNIDENTGVVPFAFDPITPSSPTEFTLYFYANSHRYWYELTLDQTQVYKEKLYVYKTSRPTKLFSRRLVKGKSVLDINTEAIKNLNLNIIQELELKCLKNMSFIAARQQVNLSMPLIDDAINELRDNIVNLIEPDVRVFDYAARQINKSASIRSHILNFIKDADFNICDIETKLEREDMSDSLMQLFKQHNFSPEQIEKMTTNINTQFRHRVINAHGVEEYSLPDQLQSRGTRRTVGIETILYNAKSTDSFVYADEMEASLHPELVELLLYNFLSTKSKSQLLATTHSSNILDTVNDLIRKDSIWFAEKKEDGSTELYSMTDFNGLNKISSFRKSYLSGRFGAVPKIN